MNAFGLDRGVQVSILTFRQATNPQQLSREFGWVKEAKKFWLHSEWFDYTLGSFLQRTAAIVSSHSISNIDHDVQRSVKPMSARSH